MKQTLALKYRPKKLSQVVGHTQVKNHIAGMLKKQEIPNAIMVAGPSGVGKTTLCRLIVRYINCSTHDACGKCSSCISIDKNSHDDYKEINGSESGNIDTIREVIKLAMYAPRYTMRVIHIDECHRMSTAASNALLVPIEEPPSNTLWLLSTTDPDKIPNHKAIMGRCAQMVLSFPDKKAITKKLMYIGKKEQFKWLKEDMCALISEYSSGHVRDAIQMLEALSMRIKGNKEKLDGDSIRALIDDIPAKTLDMNIDKIALSVLIGMYEKNPARVQKGIFSCEDHIHLINKMMTINMYYIGHMSVKTHPKLWKTKANLALVAALRDKGIKPSLNTVVKTHAALTRIRSSLFNFSVGSEHILTSELTLLASTKNAKV